MQPYTSHYRPFARSSAYLDRLAAAPSSTWACQVYVGHYCSAPDSPQTPGVVATVREESRRSSAEVRPAGGFPLRASYINKCQPLPPEKGSEVLDLELLWESASCH